jgi:hypothetical protein
MLIRLALGTTLSLGFLLYGVADWEARMGNPYGQMCNSVFTFNVDTCK